MAGVRSSRLADGAVLRVVLDEPRGNVLTTAMMGGIAEILEANRGVEDLKMVFLRGAGGNFSFGASVPEHAREKAPAMLARFHALVRLVAGFPVPVAALVEGRCLGGAFELVLASHLVFATSTAVFACPEIKLGVVPPVLSVLGAARLGGPLAEQMILTGVEIGADRARSAGLALEIAPDGEDPEAWLLGWFARTLAPLSAFSLREATWAARHGSGLLDRLDAPLRAIERRYVERLLPSHDGNEGLEAFLARRPPRWINA
jgi:cyclohexa-1,5-dienecarbonyl-CoA hydratase